MKRTIVFILIAALAAAAGSQTLLDNSYYKMGEELMAQAQDAYDQGEYDAAADYAAQAEEYFALSDEYVENMVLYQEAQATVAQAESRMNWAKAEGVDKTDPRAFSDASDSLEAAWEAMKDERYDLAVMYASATLAYLQDPRKAQVLPGSYKVVLNPALRDCLWRIAANPAIYNDPYQWRKLYEANRQRLVDPNNPDLILPGQILSVPSLYGEEREGLYDPTRTYEALRKPSK